MEEKGCTFGHVTRERVDNFVEAFEKFRDNEFLHLAKDVKKLGKRPSWVTTAVLIILSNLVVALTLAQLLGK